jgi:serine/threonine protein kinase
MNDVLNLRGTRYELVERLGSGDRERFRAFDRHAGPRGDYRAIHVLPRSKEAEQQLGVLQRLANSRNSNVPFFISHHVQGDRIYIVSSWIPGKSLAEYLHEVRAGKTSRASVFNACRLIR